MSNITIIPARPQRANSQQNETEKPKLRVAAYCRVSTDSDEQATSYETQVAHYTEYITKNPEWAFAGIYADDGISGTNTKKREEFNRMITDCMDGKIDMVITKSISRFARNTLDCLKYIRQLKDRNIPVFFEKENINTLDAKGEVLLTIMASLAQQESMSLSLKKYPHYVTKIFRLGIPNILMQSAYTFYIFGLNLILASFSDAAVTVLGLYYKWQTFFFIPLGAMQTCIVPIISFNYAARNTERCKKTLNTSIVFGMVLMFLGTLCFNLIPEPMLRFFSSDEQVVSIGITAFRIIGISFIPLVTSLTYPVLFQAVGASLKSSVLTVIRTVVLFVPLGYFFSRFGLDYFWLTYPVTESITTLVGFLMCRSFFKHPYLTKQKTQEQKAVIQISKPGVIITIAREHGSSGKQIGKLVAERLGIPFYYKEMTALAAQESGLDREFVSNINKNAPQVLHDLYLSTKPVQHAIVAQYKILRKIAENGSCVIVGRAADYVLKDNKDVVRIFIRAPREYRIGRVMEVYGDTREEAERNIQRSDNARASYYKNISGLEWGDAKNYELVIDSSEGLEKSSDIICEYIKNNYGKN